MALTLSQTKAILNRLGVCPNKKLGQNFLIEGRVVERSVAWAKATNGSIVVEIGPGCGTLTGSLVASGAKVFAVEKDPQFYQYISKNFPVNIVHGDAIEMPVGAFTLDQDYKVVANLPYAVASIWLDRILELERLPDEMVLLVQKEAADRWLSDAGTKHFSALGISLQAAYGLQASCCVAKRCFYPQPKVDSVLIHLVKKPEGYSFPKSVKCFMREIFMHRRQQIGRCCRENRAPFALSFLNFLQEQGIDIKTRAEAISLAIWVNFARKLS